MKKLIITSLLMLSAFSTQVFAGAPGGPEAGHPNLLAAREDVIQAIQKLEAAQKANDYDMAGHAAKAEKLLRQAEQEVKAAAESANNAAAAKKK